MQTSEDWCNTKNAKQARSEMQNSAGRLIFLHNGVAYALVRPRSRKNARHHAGQWEVKMASQPETQSRLAELGFWTSEADRIAKCLEGIVARVRQLASHDVKQLAGPRKSAIAMLNHLRAETIPDGVDAQGFRNAVTRLQSAVEAATELLYPNTAQSEVM